MNQGSSAKTGGEGTFSIRIDFLTRPCLADPTRRTLEWPPHPHRLFAAITAAHYEAEVGCRETLEWLERLPPPEISAPDVHERTRGSFYVPVNDPISPKSFVKSSRSLALGDRRLRQERSFSVGSLLPSQQERGEADLRSVYYVWRGVGAPPEDLDEILREVTRLGHSSSLVAASLESSPPPSVLVPDPDGPIQLRVPEAGTLARLDTAHAVRRSSIRQQDRLKPSLGAERWSSYAHAGRSTPAEGPWIHHWIWTLEPRISVTAWIHLAETIRGTLLSVLPESAPDLLTGHGDGHHLAVIPLPNVGHEHADASVLGFAILSPSVSSEVYETLLLALGELRHIGREGRLRAGAAGLFHALPLKADDLRRTLRIEEWTRPSHRWATVTPLVFDRYPKRGSPPEEIVALSVNNLGLPAPVEVRLSRDGELAGTPQSRDFRVRRPAVSAARPDHRPWSHAVLRWDRPVRGPIALGAMRHFGLGLCKPISPVESASA